MPCGMDRFIMNKKKTIVWVSSIIFLAVSALPSAGGSNAEQTKDEPSTWSGVWQEIKNDWREIGKGMKSTGVEIGRKFKKGGQEMPDSFREGWQETKRDFQELTRSKGGQPDSDQTGK